MDTSDDFGGFAAFDNADDDFCDADLKPEDDTWDPFAFSQKEDEQVNEQSCSLRDQSSHELCSLFQICKENYKKNNSADRIVLEQSFSGSTIFQHLTSDDHHNPVKFKDTTYYEFKIENILQLFHYSKVTDEPSLLSMSNRNFGCYRDEFNFHKMFGQNKETLNIKNSVPSVSKTVLSTEPKLILEKVNGFSQGNSNSLSQNNLNGLSEDKVNGLSQSNSMPDIKVLSKNAEMSKVNLKEYSGKSTDELKQIISDIENQINSYSESLLIELDQREKYKREKEIKNNFIASYIAVEAKLKQYKRKKTGFFKYADDSARNSPMSIPYFENGDGVSVEDIHSMTKILQAMEKDDIDVSRLIAEYVINVGEKHDLETVIQVRGENGVVTPIHSPSKTKPPVNR